MFRKNISSKFIVIAVLTVMIFGTCLPRASFAAGATLYLAKSSGTYVINDKFSVSVKVSTGGLAVNASEGLLSFDKDLLEVVSVSKTGSIFNLWTQEPTFSNSAGTVSYGGGSTPPGFNGQGGQVCAITFRALKAGNAQVRFNSGAVLANDGKGTNILEVMGSGSFTISPKVEPTPAEKKEEAKKEEARAEEAEKVEPERIKPVISSPTHPDPESWYNKNEAVFQWELPSGVDGVSILMNDSPSANPGPTSDGLYGTKTFTGITDGISYLHLKFNDSKGWGTIAHRKIMIDTVAPKPFTISVEQPDQNTWPLLFFHTTDEASGVLKYEITIDDIGDTAIVVEESENPSYRTADLTVGSHKAIVKAVDRAGNETYASVDFQVSSIERPVITGYSAEIKSGRELFISGTALPKHSIDIFIENKNGDSVKRTVRSDEGGNWFMILDEDLANGRYIAWAEAVNDLGLRSAGSNRVGIMVTPPIFAQIGNFVLDYFTVLVSLIFLVILIIFSLLYLAGAIRKRLRKETFEVEEVLKKNMNILRESLDKEFDALGKSKKSAELKKKAMSELDETEKSILKEIQDVEKILK